MLRLPRRVMSTAAHYSLGASTDRSNTPTPMFNETPTTPGVGTHGAPVAAKACGYPWQPPPGRVLPSTGLGSHARCEMVIANRVARQVALNSTVGTTKKSTETRLPRWFARKVRQVCDGGFRWRTTYLDTVAWEISMPSFWSSP
jgi:hypothetical protein